MTLLLSAESDPGWLAYITRGYYVIARGHTREEARVRLVQKIQKLGLPMPNPKAFEQISASTGTIVETRPTTDKGPQNE
jgi:hypothetical protein